MQYKYSERCVKKQNISNILSDHFISFVEKSELLHVEFI